MDNGTPARPSSVPALHGRAPTGPLYRIARLPDPWAWRAWAHVGSDGTFGNRFDDPSGVYRVLYASSSRLGAFVEVLARYRPDLVRRSPRRDRRRERCGPVYDRSTDAGTRRFAGITYRSRLGDDFRNWALFEIPGERGLWGGEPERQRIDAGDLDLRRAIDLLGLRLM